MRTLAGKLDEVRIYNRALSPTEVGKLYLGEKAVQLPVLQEFSSAADPKQWLTQKTFSDSDVIVGNGVASLVNRGKMITSAGTYAPLTLETRFRFSGNQNDVFRVVWGSTGDDSNIQNGALEFLNGIRFSAQMAHSENGYQGSLDLDWINHPISGGSIASFKTNLAANTYYDFRITDNGTITQVFMNGASTPILSGPSQSGFGTLVGMYNREGSGGGSSISARSRVDVDYLRIYETGAYIQITSPNSFSGAAGAVFSATMTASGTAPITFSASNLPAGLSLASNGVISGTPASVGTTITTLTASNGVGTASQEVAFVISKGTPIISVAPTAPSINYGQTLSDSLLSEGVASVAGTGVQEELFSTISPMESGRFNHTATLLLNGKVLVTGGAGQWSNTGQLSSAEWFDPVAWRWSQAGAMNTARDIHTATLLSNGKVLVAGGRNASGQISSAELFDPNTRTWIATGAMGTARHSHTATLLSNGKVLVTGGQGPGNGRLFSAELFDPVTGIWTTTSPMNEARHAHTATLLPNGKVLVTAGQDGNLSRDCGIV